MHPENAANPLPLILTGPESSAAWFEALEALLLTAFALQCATTGTIIIGDPEAVARAAKDGMKAVRRARLASGDELLQLTLHIPPALQQPLSPTHEAMAELRLTDDAEPHALAADLRRAFSGIVAGNVKEPGVRAVQRQGPFLIHAEARLKAPLDALPAALRRRGTHEAERHLYPLLSPERAQCPSLSPSLRQPSLQRLRRPSKPSWRKFSGR